MNIFTQKGIKRLIIIIFIIILLFEATVPNISNAASGVGGVLFTPIQELVLGLGDVGLDLLNLVIYKYPSSILTLNKDKSIVEKFLSFTTGGVLGYVTGITPVSIGKKVIASFTKDDFVEEIELPVIMVSPEKIFSNKIPLLDVNIINPNEYEDDNGNKVESSASILQGTIANWYVVLRDIAIVAFLSILVYIGIRILISSAVSDKAKYKQLLIDWIIGLCLLFVMHYVMSFALLITEKLSGMFDISNKAILIEADDTANGGVDLSDYNADKAEDIVKEYNLNGVGNLAWKTDFTGYIRFYAQSNIASYATSTQMAYTIMYFVLVIYTYMFLFQYLKRLINIIFLTLLAPVVAMAYPLEKASSGGSSQIFNMWIKEYIFNLLLQPMHLILYTVLIGSAIDLVTDYPLYALVVLGFLLEAEKFIRKMFKFDGAQLAPRPLGGPLTGAMVMQGVNAAVKKLSGGGKGGSKKADGNKLEGNDNSKLRLAENRTADDSSGEDDYIDNVLQASKDNVDTEETQQNSDAFDYDWGLKHPFEIDNDTDRINTEWPELDPDIFDSDRALKYPFEYDKINQNNIKQQEMPKKLDNKDKSNSKYRKIKKYASAAKTLYGPKLAKTAFKGAAMAVGAGTAGMIGVAAGLASDDLKDVGTYGIAGLTGGALAGKSLSNKAIGVGDYISKQENNIKNMKDNIVREALKNDPAEYKKYLNQRSDEEFLQNKEIRKQYAEAFGTDKSLEMMQSAIKYRQHGVTDDKLIIKAMKAKSDSLGTDVADDRRIVAAKLADKVSNEKDVEMMSKRLTQRGVSAKKVKEQEKIIRDIRGLI